MLTTEVDIVVVGAGPAGSAAAYHLSRAGLRVALIDRASFPRAKVCGDGLTPGALAEVEAMGAMSELRPSLPMESLVTIDLNDGSERCEPVPSLTGRSAGLIVSRTVLDDALRRAAVRAGAEFAPRTTVNGLLRRGGSIVGVEVQTPKGVARIRADVTVIAEGACNRLGRFIRGGRRVGAVGAAARRYLHLRAPLDPAFRLYVPLAADDAELFGYGWVFPVSAELANVGVGCFVPQQMVARPRLRRVFNQFLVALESVEPRIEVAGNCGRLEGGVIDASLPLQELAVPGALLVGDAAGAANPFTGEGIAQALASGRAAAEAVVESLGRGCRLEAAYVERLEAQFPDRSAWTAWLPWLGERGGIRTREFLELLSAPVGVLARGVKTVVLERSRAGAKASVRVVDSAPGGTIGATWASVERIVARKHPMLASLLSVARCEFAERVDGVLEAYWTNAGGKGEDLKIPLALVALMSLLAEDVGDHAKDGGNHAADPVRQSISPRAAWAVNAANLGAADLLLAECLAALVDTPAAQAVALANAARRMFATAFGDDMAGATSRAAINLASDLRDIGARLGAEVACARSGEHSATAGGLSGQDAALGEVRATLHV